MHSHDFQNILVVIDKHFWTLKEKSNSIVFDRKDKQASNPKEQFLDSPGQSKGNYSFSFIANNGNNMSIVFYGVFTQ